MVTVIYIVFYGHGLLATHGYRFYLERHTHATEKNNRVISVSNKETVAAAELKADHKFNFAEQTPPCFSVCMVCLLLH